MLAAAFQNSASELPGYVVAQVLGAIFGGVILDVIASGREDFDLAAGFAPIAGAALTFAVASFKRRGAMKRATHGRGEGLTSLRCSIPVDSLPKMSGRPVS